MRKDNLNLRKEIDFLKEVLNCRAGKMLLQDIPFIVVSKSEPYYTSVYLVIREERKAREDWTDECEKTFQEATQYNENSQFPMSKSELYAIWRDQHQLCTQAEKIEQLKVKLKVAEAEGEDNVSTSDNC